MRKIMNTVVLLLIIAVTVKLTLWAYQGLTRDTTVLQQGTVLDADITCLQVPDTGQCMCRHRDTNQRIDVPYDDCVRRVMRAQR